MLTGLDGEPWSQNSLPVLLDLSSRTRPYDIPFDKVRENLLNLDSDLADMVVKLNILIHQLNWWLRENTEGLVGYSTHSTSSHSQMLDGLQRTKKTNRAMAEYVFLLAQTSKEWRRQLFAGKKKLIIDWKPIDTKLQEIDHTFVEASRIL
jgi:hypothetical protein